MSDYQAIYDAVRSRISGGNIGDVAREVMWQQFDISHTVQMLGQDFSIAALEMQRPSVLYRPAIFLDGNKWCALYGANLQDGVAGFGDSPALAMQDFDKEWADTAMTSTTKGRGE